MTLMLAFFAGGCFWCMEKDFEKIDGVQEVISGYIDGNHPQPTYEIVSAGKSGHTEAIQISYDPKKITYEKLLKKFWVNIDPTTANGQFCDQGSQYRSGIYYGSQKEKELAEASLQVVRQKFSTVHTEIKKASKFFPAEEYHQNYYKKKPTRYRFYRYNCGRDRTLKRLWGDPPIFPSIANSSATIQKKSDPAVEVKQ